ncbi:MAG: lysylphosphatidylglycerol synthase transmembrane domain-containing protein [Pseudomonadota bacterium]
MSEPVHDPLPEAPPLRRRISLTGWALLAFAALIAVGVTLAGWEDAARALATLGFLKIAALSGLALAHYAIRALRWHIMVRTGGVDTSWRLNMLHFFAGFAMTATPGRVGELVRLRWLMRATGQGFGHLLPIAFADRAIELASIVGLIAIALVAANLGSSAVFIVLGAGGLLVAIACQPVALLAAVNGAYRLTGRRWPKLFVKLRRLTRRLGPFMRLPVFLPVLVLGMIGWSFEGLAFWLLLDWLGANMPLATATAIFLTAVLSGALSGLPGGLGGTEATSVALLLLQGVPLDIAVLATAIIRVATLWFAVGIGFVVLPFAEARRDREPAA